MNYETYSKLKNLGIELQKSGKQTCPKCSAERHNKTDKCLSVTFQDKAVVFYCHHCGWTGSVMYHDYTQKKHYNRPEGFKSADNTKPLVDYFSKRKISVETLNKYNVTMDNDGRIIFPYYKDNILVNVKTRQNLENGKKTFTQTKDAEKTFFGIDLVKGQKDLIIVEGECFRGDTEILTPNGWVRLDEYNGQYVMQVDNLVGKFVQPFAFIEKQYNGNLLEYKSRNGILRATENHNIFYTYNGRNKYHKKKFIDVPKGANIITSITFNGDLTIEEKQLRLLIAIQADGTLDYRKNGNIYIRFAVKKERKAIRIESLLKALNKQYTKTIDGRGYYYFGFTENSAFKEFPKSWYNLSSDCIGVILDEILYWDGNRVPNRNQIEYSTKHYENAIFIQTIAHLYNYSSSIIKRKNKFGEWYKVSILYNKKSFTLCRKPNKIQYNDKVYCVQVPSGLILTRTDNKIAITGNCDVLALAEQGIYAVSVPQGGSDAKLECLSNCDDDFLTSFQNFVIAVDNDEVGNKLKNSLLSRFPKDKCKVVNWEQYKDANEALVAGEDLHYYINGAKYVQTDGIYTFDESSVWDKVYNELFEVDKNFYSTGWKRLDEFIKIKTGHLMVVTGYPSRGKSTFVDNLLINLAKKYPDTMKHLIASFENTFGNYYKSLFEMYMQKPIYQIKNEFQDKSLEKILLSDAFEFINEHFILFDNERMWSIDEICERTEIEVMKHGIKTLVIDPYNRLKNDYKDREDKYIGNILSKLCMLAKRLDILVIFVAHPKKPDAEKTPSMYSISGSGDWYNMSDYGIIVHRERSSDGHLKDIPQITIAKVKNFSLGNPSGGIIEMFYDVSKRIILDK